MMTKVPNRWVTKVHISKTQARIQDENQVPNELVFHLDQAFKDTYFKTLPFRWAWGVSLRLSGFYDKHLAH